MNRPASVEDEIAVHRPALLVYAYRLSGDDHEAEDIVQAALAKALVSMRSGIETENPRAWLYRIVHNEALSVRRGARRHRAALAFLPRGERTGNEGREKLFGRVERELGRLDEPYRSALRLRYLQHLKIEEVADVLQLPIGTVKSQLARGLRILAERLGNALEGDEA